MRSIRRVARDAGIVDEDVDLAELCEDGLGGGIDGVFTGEIEREDLSRATGGTDFVGYGGQLIFAAGAEGDGGAVAGELERDGASDTLRSASDQSGAAVEFTHGAALLAG